MTTLYIRAVPDEVSDGLKRLAESAGMSVSAFALKELAQVARRADNPALLATLPDLAISTDRIVAEIDGSRHER